MLDALIRAYQSGDRPGALGRAYHLAFLALVIPGVPLGLLYWATRPAPYPTGIALTLVAVAAVLAAAVLVKVTRTLRGHAAPLPVAERLTASMQLGSAPGVPFLLGCSAFHDPLTWLGCWAVALGAYLLGRQRVQELSHR